MTRRRMAAASRVVVSLVVLACGPGTGHGRAERRGSDTRATIEEVPVCGFAVRVELVGDRPAYEGELIAVSDAEIVVLMRDELARIPRLDAERVIVDVLSSTRTGAALWTAGGAISSLSHGYYAVLSLPAWIVFGTLSARELAHSERWAFGADAPEIREYARFPQGLPPGWPAPGARAGSCPPASAAVAGG